MARMKGLTKPAYCQQDIKAMSIGATRYFDEYCSGGFHYARYYFDNYMRELAYFHPGGTTPEWNDETYDRESGIFIYKTPILDSPYRKEANKVRLL